MLPARHRVRTAADFRRVIRSGTRAGGGLLVVHAARTAESSDPRMGFVVPRSVGSAVVRNRVRRRLRHLARARLDSLPVGTDLVVRVLPAAAGSSSDALAEALDRGLRKVSPR